MGAAAAHAARPAGSAGSAARAAPARPAKAAPARRRATQTTSRAPQTANRIGGPRGGSFPIGRSEPQEKQARPSKSHRDEATIDLTENRWHHDNRSPNSDNIVMGREQITRPSSMGRHTVTEC